MTSITAGGRYSVQMFLIVFSKMTKGGEQRKLLSDIKSHNSSPLSSSCSSSCTSLSPPLSSSSSSSSPPPPLCLLLLLLPALKWYHSKGSIQAEVEEMQEEQSSLSSVQAVSVLGLLVDRSVRWQLATIAVVNVGMQLSGIDAVSSPRRSQRAACPR